MIIILKAVTGSWVVLLVGSVLKQVCLSFIFHMPAENKCAKRRTRFHVSWPAYSYQNRLKTGGSKLKIVRSLVEPSNFFLTSGTQGQPTIICIFVWLFMRVTWKWKFVDSDFMETFRYSACGSGRTWYFLATNHTWTSSSFFYPLLIILKSLCICSHWENPRVTSLLSLKKIW